MSFEYRVFIIGFTVAVAVACLVAFTRRGHELVLAYVPRFARSMGMGPWGLLHPFGYLPDTQGLSVEQRAELAEEYIAVAEVRTLAAARAVAVVLIGGCVFTGATGIVISGVLPPLVENGAWSYDMYTLVARWLIGANVIAGTGAGALLVYWLYGRTVALNRTDGCAIAGELVVAARGAGIGPAWTSALAGDSYPRLSRLLSDVV